MIEDALRDAIARFRVAYPPIGERDRAVLDRLTPRADPDGDRDYSALVLPAFKMVPPELWPSLLYACARAAQEQHQHKDVVEHSKRIVEGAEDALKVLEVVERFVGLVEAVELMSAEWSRAGCPWHPAHRLGREQQSAPAAAPEREALDALREWTLFARRQAERDLRRASQKTGKASGRAAGIGSIKDAILRCAPNAKNPRRLAADLATAVLDAEEISEDMVRHARTPRERLDRMRGAFRSEKS